MAATLTPAQRLVGTELPGGWRVVRLITRDARLTGGTYSACYVVEGPASKVAFLKAIDIEKVMRTQMTAEDDPLNILEDVVTRYNIERELVKVCRGKDRVVTGITDGQLKIDTTLVPYLIFESAQSDVREVITGANRLEDAWKMRVMHHVATGLFQLHSSSIAHQDLKPSNVMLFAGDIAKVGDLGRASEKGRTGPVDVQTIAGDKTYAPIEQHYGYVLNDWEFRRLAADFYLLGSLAVYLFTGFGLTAQIMSYVHPLHHCSQWRGTYEEVLQHIMVAYLSVIEEVAQTLPELIRDQMIETVKLLTHPSPERRGDPRSIAEGAQLSLVRVVERFNLMANRLERSLK